MHFSPYLFKGLIGAVYLLNCTFIMYTYIDLKAIHINILRKIAKIVGGGGENEDKI